MLDLIKRKEIKMREFLKSPLVQTLKVWESLEPEMTKEAEVIAKNLNMVFPYDIDGIPMEWKVGDCMCDTHLLSLVPLILTQMMPSDEDYGECGDLYITNLLDIGCSIGFLAPFCEHYHINYIGVDSDTIGREKNKYSEHIRFKQNDPNAHYVRYIEGDIKDIDSEWARAHDIIPSKTFVVCAYCPPCKGDDEISRNLKARLAYEFEKCLIL